MTKQRLFAKAADREGRKALRDHVRARGKKESSQNHEKTIYCPACGKLCVATEKDEQVTAMCVNNHKWSVLLDFNSTTSDDGTSIISFQCDGTSVYELPDNPMETRAVKPVRIALWECSKCGWKTSILHHKENHEAYHALSEGL